MDTKMNVFLIFSCLVVLCSCEKYSKRSNEAPTTFKMGKVNSIWEKGQKELKGNRLADLYADLVIQDKKERDLKKKKAEGADPDGLWEADVRKDLLDILRKYNLTEYFPEQYGGNLKQKSGQFQLKDDRLKELMKTAREGQFTDKEMETLKEELGHQQMKLEEFNALKKDYDAMQDQMDNSLDNLDEKELLLQDIAAKKNKMKTTHQRMKEDMKLLKKKIVSEGKRSEEFKDPRVYQLWALAQKSGMSETELASIKKELTHFEHRIMKAKFIQEQLDKTASIDGENSMAHKELKQRAEHYDAKVDKYHEDLSHRINKRLDEL